MATRRRRGRAPEPSFVLLASDPLVIAVARDAADRLAASQPILVASPAEALSRLFGPGEPPDRMVIHHASASVALLTAAGDRFLQTEIVIVAGPGDAVPPGLRRVPAEGARLAEALAGVVAPATLPAVDAAALSASLDRGEITVRFQPVVRLADRRLASVEALARWERPALALGAGAFVAMAESAGLARALTLAVARRAVAEFAEARRRRGLRLAFNVPLEVLLWPALPARLGAILREARMKPQELLLELTESTEVRDAGLLRRALRRLRAAGFGVMLDDLCLYDARGALLDLPFAGVKLDRSLVAALPFDRRARAEVERLARRAHRAGAVVIAEGVSDALLWRCAAAAGCDLAQGYAVGRPIAPESLSAWVDAWRGG